MQMSGVKPVVSADVIDEFATQYSTRTSTLRYRQWGCRRWPEMEMETGNGTETCVYSSDKLL